jgi:SAM-dependent methyltransferase
VTFNDMPGHWYEDYERGRPDYPSEVVDLPDLPVSATVLDLGAGTGKLTRLLVSRFVRVIAVEPDDQMRSLLVALCPDAVALAGSAEQIPLTHVSVDAVFAAQCFHNFDRDRALAEIARVLRPGGALVLLWNVPTGPAEPSIAPVEELLAPRWPKGWDPLDLGNPFRYAAGERRTAFAHPAFDELQHARLPNPQTVDRDELVGFFDSMGWIAILPEDDRLALLDEVRSLLTATQYVLPWETHAQWTRLRTP